MKVIVYFVKPPDGKVVEEETAPNSGFGLENSCRLSQK